MSASKIIVSQLLAKRYTKAILDIATQRNKVEIIAEDFQKLSQILRSSSACAKFVADNYASYQKIQEKLVGIFKEELKISDLTVDFLKILIANSRLYVLPQIIDQFFLSLQELNNEITVRVTSVKPLSREQEENLKDVLGKYFSKKITISSKIDESILGGMVITAGSKMIDMSLLGKLNFMNLSSKEALLTEFK